MVRARGLGRGLGALLHDDGPDGALLALALHVIVPNPRQPRSHIAPDELSELAASLQQVGMLQPILVRPARDGRYEIVAGERRFRAAHLAGLATVPAIVRHTDDDRLLTEALIENLHRVDLSPLDEAAAYEQLVSEFDLTHETLAQRLGKSRSAITNALRLLGLPPSVQRRLADQTLGAGHARALLAVDDQRRQEELAQRIVAENLSVRAVEQLVRQQATGKAAEDAQQTLARNAQQRAAPRFGGLERRLQDAFSTRVHVRGTVRRGRIIIDYAGRDDLDRLLVLLGRGSGADLLEES